MCGIVGIAGTEPVSVRIYDALTVLQHRGQDAAGIATSDGRRLNVRKNNGLVRDVFRPTHMHELTGNLGLGHVRYPTAGSSDAHEAQPFCLSSPHGIALAHNGNLINTDSLRQELTDQGIALATNSDSEVLLNIFANALPSDVTHPTDDDIFAAVREVNKKCKGGYAVVAMLPNVGLIGFRDPNGIRPVIFGKRPSVDGDEYMLASESVALDVAGFEPVRDIDAGEAVIFRHSVEPASAICADHPEHHPCIFEYVYLARPDSIIDGISVYKSRLRMGDKLAQQVKDDWPDHDIDVVIPVPDTSRSAAIQMAHRLGVKYREGFIKNRYIGRTFIMPGQQLRKKSVRKKLNAIELEFKDKNVLLVDDSIVRGTTCSQIIQMAREAGAKKVYFASAAPAVRNPNVYGIDMPAASELIAHGRTTEEVQEAIGADRLFYQHLDDLLDSAREGNPERVKFEDSVFSGSYITGDVEQSYLDELEAARNDQAKKENEPGQEIALA